MSLHSIDGIPLALSSFPELSELSGNATNNLNLKLLGPKEEKPLAPVSNLATANSSKAVTESANGVKTEDINYYSREKQENLTNYSVQSFSFLSKEDLSISSLDNRAARQSLRPYSVVVIDTGADLDHPAFGPDADRNGIADRIVYQYDFADNDNLAEDRSGHGTHVAGIIGSQNSSYLGVAPNVNLIVLKVFRDNGTGSTFAVRDALEWAARNVQQYNIISVNMSLSNGFNYREEVTSSYTPYTNSLVNQGVTITAAAGNSFRSHQSPGVGSPASDPYVWAVSAHESNGDLTAYSQRDPNLTTVTAAGSATNAFLNGGYRTLHGTSMASPVVAGAVAVAQEAAFSSLGRTLTVAELESLIIQSSDSSFDPVLRINFPKLNVARLVQTIEQLDPSSLPPSATITEQVVKQEGNSGTTDFNFVVNLNFASNKASVINYFIKHITTNSQDFASNQGELIIPAGQTSGVITVKVKGDTEIEANESFSLELEPRANVVLTNTKATGIISNDDVPTLSISNVQKSEGNSGLTPFTFTLSLDKPAVTNVTGRVVPVSMTARVGEDILFSHNSFEIKAGQLQTSVTFQVRGDNVLERDELFRVVTNTLRGAVLSKERNQGYGIILNDDGFLGATNKSNSFGLRTSSLEAETSPLIASDNLLFSNQSLFPSVSQGE